MFAQPVNNVHCSFIDEGHGSHGKARKVDVMNGSSKAMAKGYVTVLVM